MFIDIHAHAYRKPVPFIAKFCTPEELLALYDKLGIDKGVLLPIVSPEIYLPQTNEDILDMCAKYPDRFIPFCNIDPRAMTNSANAPLNQLLEYYKQKGCKGLGEVMPNMALMDPLVQNLFNHAEKAGLPVIYDGSDQLSGDFGIYDDPGLPQLEHTLQRFPNLIIFGHGPVFWSEISQLQTPGERGFIFDLNGHQVGRLPEGLVRKEGVVPVMLRRYPNLYGDLSDLTSYNALTRDEHYGQQFLEEFQDKLFFGTDIISPDFKVPLIDLLKNWRDTKKISLTAFNKITSGNAIKLLGI